MARKDVPSSIRAWVDNPRNGLGIRIVINNRPIVAFKPATFSPEVNGLNVTKLTF